MYSNSKHWLCTKPVQPYKNETKNQQIWHCLVQSFEHTNPSILSNTARRPVSMMLESPLHHCLKHQGREPSSVQHTSLRSQSVNCSHDRPLRPGLLKHPQQDPLKWDTNEECLPTCWELWEARELPSNKESLEWKVCIDLWHIPPETWREPEKLILEEETHNSPETVRDCLTHSTLRLPKGMDYPECNKVTLKHTWGCKQIHLWLSPKSESCPGNVRKKMPLWH